MLIVAAIHAASVRGRSFYVPRVINISTDDFEDLPITGKAATISHKMALSAFALAPHSEQFMLNNTFDKPHTKRTFYIQTNLLCPTKQV